MNKEKDQIDSTQKKETKQHYDSDSNEELYNQAIDDEGNTVSEEKPKKLSAYEQEYNDVI
jgi:hypothetical protein